MFKIGDRVKLEHWKNFLPIVGIAGNSIEIQEDDAKGLYSLDQNFIKEETIMEKVMKPVDEFRVGDEVWCVQRGKGKVAEIECSDKFCVFVEFDNQDILWFTKDGRILPEYGRTLFFSEPKVEASLTRPFVPTLVGKTVVVKQRDIVGKYFLSNFLTITHETEVDFGNDNSNYNKECSEIYEVSSDNLLKR